MKKKYICITALGLILLSGCGNAIENNNVTTVEEASTPSVALSTIEAILPWNQSITKEKCNLFEKADLVSYDEGSAQWKNDKAMAQLQIKDNMTYLTYQSQLGECNDIEFDYIQPKMLANTCFYEADINNDGIKELLLSYIQGTGTGYSKGGMCIYDFEKDKFIPLFSGKEKAYDFTDEQKQDILSVIAEWNTRGFKETENVEINNISDINTSVFNPTLVKSDGQYKIQVEILLPGADNYKNSKTFYALFDYNDGNLKLDSLYCR